MLPTIKKARFVRGKNLFIREIEETDAEFILNLRLAPLKSKYLSVTSEKLDDQINWIRGYKNKLNQAYFVVCDNSGVRLGSIRMYDQIEYSYCWGSWIMVDGLSPLAAVESALLIYAYGDFLGFKEARLDVRQDNKYVLNFHEKFSSAEIVKETESDIFYIVRKHSIDTLLEKYKNLVTNPLEVEFY